MKKISKTSNYLDKKKLSLDFEIVQDLMRGNNLDSMDNYILFISEKNYEASTTTQEMISMLKKEIGVISQQRNALLNKVNRCNSRLKPFLDLVKQTIGFSQSSYKSDDIILKDLSFDNKISLSWRAYLKKKQESSYLTAKPAISTFKEEQDNLLQEDIVCVICNDGDYEENDLIVYCSVSFVYLFFIRVVNLQFIKIAMEFLIFLRMIGYAMFA